MRTAEGLEFDIMLESKSKDLSLLRLRADMLRYAPDVAARFGITAADAQRLAEDEALVDEEADSEEDADVDEGGLAANG